CARERAFPGYSDEYGYWEAVDYW
nr:immunoglobulin heavy chain junction region [Macaca mulatta]